MAVITMRQMLEAGVHFGHQTRRWNPKMKRFIFGERNGIYIIDLEQTLTRVEVAYNFVRELVAGGGNVLFVGTKKQAQDPVRSYAEKCGMPYVNERWLGGMLTNFETMSKRVGKMLEYERMKASGEFEVMIKKEALMLDRELEKLQRNLGGLRGMKQRPDAIFVLDTKKEHIAVTEANKLGIPVVAVVDTNVDPDVVQFPIPGNDDAIRANSLLTRVIADAVEEGRYIAAKRNPIPAPPQRSAEEDAAFEKAQADARNAAAQAQAERDARLRAPKPDPTDDDVDATADAAAVAPEAVLEAAPEAPDAVEPAAGPVTEVPEAVEPAAATEVPEAEVAAADPEPAADETPAEAEPQLVTDTHDDTVTATAADAPTDAETETPADADTKTPADSTTPADTKTPADTTTPAETETETES
jgi:small subunit ribosomal protein S2